SFFLRERKEYGRCGGYGVSGALKYLTAHFRNLKDLVASMPSTLATSLHTLLIPLIPILCIVPLLGTVALVPCPAAFGQGFESPTVAFAVAELRGFQPALVGHEVFEHAVAQLPAKTWETFAGVCG